MAVVENRTTSEGDVLVIRPEIPRVGFLSLLNFTDQTSGEDQVNYFKKFFRYSTTAGLHFSEWKELTNINIMSIQSKRSDSFVIEMKYERMGNVGIVSFQNILLNGDFEQVNYPYFEKTPFAKFFEIKDINVFTWALNVLEKIYDKGILPEYIVRQEESEMDQDEDFIAFWNSVTEFFGILVYYARQFEVILSNQDLLSEYARERGLYLNTDIQLDQLNSLIRDTYKEFEHRGTNRVIEKKGGLVLNDGELLRLICYRNYEEFLFGLTTRGEMGWCLGKSSPLFKGSEGIVNLNKSYEKGSISDLNKYPLTNKGGVSIVTKEIEDRSDIELVKNGDFSEGLKYWDNDKGISAELMNIKGRTCAKISDMGQLGHTFFQDIDNSKVWEVSFYALEGTADSISIYRDLSPQLIIDLTSNWVKHTIKLYPSQTKQLADQNSENLYPTEYFYITGVSIKQWGYEKSMIRLDPRGISAGIGNHIFRDKLIPIDDSLDYEISFKVIAEDNVPDLEFGALGFNQDGTDTVNLLNRAIGLHSDSFFRNTRIPMANKTYWIRGIIYKRGTPNDGSDKLSVGFGYNLIFGGETHWLMPVIKCENSIKYIYDIEVRPLELPCSRGTLSARNMTFVYSKNRSEFTDEKVERIIDNELIPYNQFTKHKWL